MTTTYLLLFKGYECDNNALVMEEDMGFIVDIVYDENMDALLLGPAENQVQVEEEPDMEIEEPGIEMEVPGVINAKYVVNKFLDFYSKRDSTKVLAMSFISDIKNILNDVKADLINLEPNEECSRRIEKYFRNIMSIIGKFDSEYKFEKFLKDEHIFHEPTDILAAAGGKEFQITVSQ